MTGKEIAKQLEQNGWQLIRINGSHHIYQKGNQTIVVPIHSNKDLPKGLENRIMKDAGLK